VQPAGAVEEALPVKTSAIILRVADFLKRYPPFASLEEEALLEVARSGRVRYCEREEILFEEGKPCGKHLFVIQTGAIRLVRGPDRELVDLRGAGPAVGESALEVVRHVDDHPFGAGVAAPVQQRSLEQPGGLVV